MQLPNIPQFLFTHLAELTHFQLYLNCAVAGYLFGYRDDDIALAVLPLFHVFGLSGVLNEALWIGKPIWGVEVRVVGEIVIRGHNVMKGYDNKPEATAEVFRGGWFHTGDLAYVDDEGYLHCRPQEGSDRSRRL